jgi:hypothetical protein
MDGLDKAKRLHIMCNWVLSGKSHEQLVSNISLCKELIWYCAQSFS